MFTEAAILPWLSPRLLPWDSLGEQSGKWGWEVGGASPALVHLVVPEGKPLEGHAQF